jgi:hypothetical protein
VRWGWEGDRGFVRRAFGVGGMHLFGIDGAWMCITYTKCEMRLLLLVLDSVSRYFGKCIGKQIILESLDPSFLAVKMFRLCNMCNM